MRVLLSLGSPLEESSCTAGLRGYGLAVRFCRRQLASLPGESAGRHTDIDPRRKIRIRCQRIPLCGPADLVGMAFLCDLQFARFQLDTLARISLVQSKPIPNLAPLSITTTSRRRVHSEERYLNVLQQMAMTKAGVATTAPNDYSWDSRQQLGRPNAQTRSCLESAA